MRKVIESIYGMQYEELIQNGRDGNKARLNGNLFLAAYVIVLLFLLFIICTHISVYNETLDHHLGRVFGVFNVRMLEKILIIPLFGGIYFLIAFTIGSQSSFQKHVDAYKQYSDMEQRKSFLRVLVPFIIILVLILVLSWL